MTTELNRVRSSGEDTPIRLFQIVENLDRGAVENWLVRMFLASREQYPEYHWTFYCSLGRPGRLDELVKAAGGEIIYSLYPLGQPLLFMRHLRAVLKAGNYDVLHAHHDVMSSLYLAAAFGLPLKRRIVHVHNADLSLPTANRAKALVWSVIMRVSCLLLADQIVGISRHTLANFLGSWPRKSQRDSVVYYGVDTSRSPLPASEKATFRETFGFSEQSEVLLFSGRMVWFKNPCFVIDVLYHLRDIVPDAVALFAGTGELEPRIQEMAERRGIADRVRVLGWRDDISTLMQGSDLFIFPRVEKRIAGVGREGLGLVVVEAQSAGLPVLMSRGVPEDAIAIPELCDVASLTEGPREWARRAASLLSRPKMSADEARRRIEGSQFSLSAGVAAMMRLYDVGVSDEAIC